MASKDLLTRAGNACEFCGATNALDAVDVPPAGEILLCPICREDEAADASHWRCLEGAAWSAEPAVQLAVWRKLATIAEPWATEARDGMVLCLETLNSQSVPGMLLHHMPDALALVRAVMPGMIELGEDIFLKPVRRGLPKYSGGLADMVSQPRAATVMGLLEEARLARLRGYKVTQKKSSVNNAFGRFKDFIVGNF